MIKSSHKYQSASGKSMKVDNYVGGKSSESSKRIITTSVSLPSCGSDKFSTSQGKERANVKTTGKMK